MVVRVVGSTRPSSLFFLLSLHGITSHFHYSYDVTCPFSERTHRCLAGQLLHPLFPQLELLAMHRKIAWMKADDRIFKCEGT